MQVRLETVIYFGVSNSESWLGQIPNAWQQGKTESVTTFSSA